MALFLMWHRLLMAMLNKLSLLHTPYVSSIISIIRSFQYDCELQLQHNIMLKNYKAVTTSGKHCSNFWVLVLIREPLWIPGGKPVTFFSHVSRKLNIQISWEKVHAWKFSSFKSIFVYCMKHRKLLNILKSSLRHSIPSLRHPTSIIMSW